MFVTSLSSEYENAKLTAYRDCDFTIGKMEAIILKYYMNYLCVRGKSNFAGRGAAMWAGHKPNFTGCYNCGEKGHFQEDCRKSRRKGCLGCLLDSNMRRSWSRYIFVTPHDTGLILPSLALLPPCVFSSKLVRK